MTIMKKTLFYFTLLLIANFIFIGCSSDDEDELVSDIGGVVISGVRWATRNVDAPGTFAATPESVGMFYQWNRRTALAATGEVANWDSSIPTGTEWESHNDPCPPNWRVPTYAELNSLMRTTSIWTNRRGVNGRLFGRAPYQVFLPATGKRIPVYENNIFLGGGTDGAYWSSSTQSGGGTARYLSFGSGNAIGGIGGMVMAHSVRSGAMPIRCVAK